VPAFRQGGWQDGKSDIDISITHAQSDLTGNGSCPQLLRHPTPGRPYTLLETQKPYDLLTVNATRC